MMVVLMIPVAKRQRAAARAVQRATRARLVALRLSEAAAPKVEQPLLAELLPTT